MSWYLVAKRHLSTLIGCKKDLLMGLEVKDFWWIYLELGGLGEMKGSLLA